MVDGWQATTARLRGLLASSLRDRGDAARDRGDWLGAVESYQAHLDQHPEDGAIWVQLGHASKEDGDLEGALAAYRRAEAELGDDADLQLNIGHLFKRMGRIGPALAAYRRSAELAPGLFAGEALTQVERIDGRFRWRTDPERGARVPSDFASLLEVMDVAQAGTAGPFRSYFRSFEMR
ncbi:BTAD domain-containing putative transcriptional regulator [uncultured Sphingomonas sp.]|uniref:BTAD domain-containing putative transcriptional regulator n=1 Tax=uncultured Sphingomonas sp. TaxID=158754 RepID=UPI0035CBDFE9